MKRLETVDYLKGFSIFTIVLMHLCQGFLMVPNIVNKGVSFGGAGVHIFILCSGFGLYLSYLNKRINYVEFLKRRFSKVYIPYIIVIVISSLIPIIGSNLNKIKALFSHVFLYKMFIEEYENSFGIQFWFVSTIIQFYFLFYIIVKIKERIKDNKYFIFLSLIISIMWWIIVYLLGKTDIRVWNSFFLQYLWEFSLGMVLADIYNDSGKLNIPNKLVLIIFAMLGVSITAVLVFSNGVFKSFNDIFSMIGYGCCALFIYSLSIKPINYVFLKIGEFSYEWYLVHILIFDLTFFVCSGINKYIVGAIALVLSIVAAQGYRFLLNKK